MDHEPLRFDFGARASHRQLSWPAGTAPVWLTVFLCAAAPAGAQTPFDAQPDWILEADMAEAFFGGHVAAAGDVDGDGLDDVLVGAPYFGNGESREGAVFLFRGRTSPGRPAPDWILEGGRTDAFRYLATAAGDVNGDGFDDVIVGDPDWPDEPEGRGRAMVFLGSAGGLASEPAWSVEGDRARRRLGARVGSAGDSNRDGLADIVVSGRGVVMVFLGSPAGPEPSAAWSLEGLLPADFGRGPAALDASGDRFDDLLVAYLGSGFESFLSLHRGYPLGLQSRAHFDLSVAATAGGDFGVAFSPAGDVDGDGFAELLVSTPGRLEVPHGSPCCPPEHVYLFEAGGRGLREPGTLIHTTRFHNDLVPLGTDGAGDVNGDGFDDLMVAEYAVEPGAGLPPIRILVFAGSPGGAEPAATLWGLQFNDGFGEVAARAGDFDGDGYDDLIVAAPRHDDGETNEGAAFVFRGGPFPPN